MPARTERPQVPVAASVQEPKMIMSLLHSGAGKQLVVGPVLDEKSSPP
jgi:hypothetical protein